MCGTWWERFITAGRKIQIVDSSTKTNRYIGCTLGDSSKEQINAFVAKPSLELLSIHVELKASHINSKIIQDNSHTSRRNCWKINVRR